MKAKFLLLTLLFVSTFSWANDPIFNILSRNFEDQFLRRRFHLAPLTSFYQRGACANNIYYLLKKLSLSKQNLENAKVIYVLDFGPRNLNDNFYNKPRESQTRYFTPNPLLTRYSKYDKPVRWTLHVFLESAGKIYDFDFTESPTVINKEEYFKRMYFYKQDIKAEMDYSIRIIPAKDYLNLYTPTTAEEKHDVPGSYLQFIDGEVRGQQFPLLFLKDYLSKSDKN